MEFGAVGSAEVEVGGSEAVGWFGFEIAVGGWLEAGGCGSWVVRLAADQLGQIGDAGGMLQVGRCDSE